MLSEVFVGWVNKEHTDHIKNFDKEITKIVNNDPVCKLLLSVPGVGHISAFAIVAEVGDFSRFPDSGKLASFAGIVPSQRSSGGNGEVRTYC